MSENVKSILDQVEKQNKQIVRYEAERVLDKALIKELSELLLSKSVNDILSDKNLEIRNSVNTENDGQDVEVRKK